MSELDRLCRARHPARVKEARPCITGKAIDKKLIRASLDRGHGRRIHLRRVSQQEDTPDARRDRLNIPDQEEKSSPLLPVILRELAIKIPLASPVDFITRFGAELTSRASPQRAPSTSLESAKRAASRSQGSHGPRAAALYISTLKEGERRTQREIAEIAHVTEVTVRNRYKNSRVSQINVRCDPLMRIGYLPPDVISRFVDGGFYINDDGKEVEIKYAEPRPRVHRHDDQGPWIPDCFWVLKDASGREVIIENDDPDQ